jgi:cold shock CspA family protein
MTIESQAQSKRSNNLKLSAAQIAMLTQIEHRFMSQMEVATQRVSEAKRAAKLETMGLLKIIYADFFYITYEMTNEGRAAIGAEPIEPDASDELPAKMPMPAIVDADTAPVMDVVTVDAKYAANDHVRFNYFRDPNYKDEVYQGRIMERAFDRLCGWMYRIDPAPCAFHLSPRWISERYVRETLTGEAVASMVASDHVSALYDVMERAETVYMDYARMDTFDMPADHATFKRKVSAHIAFLRAQSAYTGVRSDAMITYLYGAQNAHQTPHNGTPAAVDDVQAFSANLDQRKPEIASEPVMQQSAETSRIEGHVKTYNKKEGWGYIVTSDGNEYYFRNTNLHRIASAHHLNRGTSVTFVPMAAIGENAGMAKATGVMIGSYIPDVRPMHQINPSIQLEAKEAEQARKGKKQEQRIFRQQQADKNAASMSTLRSAK